MIFVLIPSFVHNNDTLWLMERLPNKDFYNFDLYANLPDQKGLEGSISATQTTVIVLQQATANDLTLLEKILAAVQQDLHKDCVVVQQKTPIAFKTIQQFSHFQRLLVFGWTPKDMGLHLQIQPYQIVPFQSCQLLFAPNLEVIATNQNNEKKKLWGQLQQLYK